MSTTDQTPPADVLRHAPDGIVVVQGSPAHVHYANETLAGLLQMPVSALVGRALEEIEIEAPLDAVATAGCGSMRVQLKRTDGSVVACERWAVLLPDGRLAMYYRPLQRVVAATAIDRANGLATAEHLLETLRRDWSIGQRDGRAITLLRFDVDGCREYREVFGQGATDSVLRQIGRTIAATMRRASDVVARFGDDEFVALGVAMEPPSASAFAETILGRIRRAGDPPPAFSHRTLHDHERRCGRPPCRRGDVTARYFSRRRSARSSAPSTRAETGSRTGRSETPLSGICKPQAPRPVPAPPRTWPPPARKRR